MTYIWREPGTTEHIACSVCGEQMKVTRGVYGPTCWAAAVGGSKHLHDAFSCPCGKEDWHRQIEKLSYELYKTSSSKVAKLIEEEIAEIKQTRTATRKVSEW